ncbi:MAG: hypothetical protein O3A92_12125, partial [Verrucomicrobia bacterium]|nr:hypothetical protein [Verrucomicrobiota bacterium]
PLPAARVSVAGDTVFLHLPGRPAVAIYHSEFNLRSAITSPDGKLVAIVQGTGSAGDWITFLHRIDQTNGSRFIAEPLHDAGMTPDQSQLWLSDQQGKRLYTFDMTVTPPKQTGHLDLGMGGHGWITFSLDGQYAYSHTPDIFDVNTRKKVATLRDEHGQKFASSKFIEVHLDNGKVVKVGNEFGLGRAPN